MMIYIRKKILLHHEVIIIKSHPKDHTRREQFTNFIRILQSFFNSKLLQFVWKEVIGEIQIFFFFFI